MFAANPTNHVTHAPQQSSAKYFLFASLLVSLLVTGCGGGSTEEGSGASLQTTITNPFADPGTTTAFVSSTSVYQNQLAVDLNYDVNANPDVVGFKIYDQQGVEVCTKSDLQALETQDPLVYHLECYYDAANQSNSFTMTAFDSTGTESAPSAAFSPNIAPVAVLQANVVGDTVSFDASTSYDPNSGSVVSYTWRLGDGTLTSGATLDHIYQPGVYTVTLDVVDNEGAVAQTIVEISIT